MSKQIYFVSGIDTGIGKSIATGLYAKELAAAGRRVITQKIIQTGCRGIAEDIRTHRRLQGIGLTEYDYNGMTCPYVFAYPCSPHLAAEQESRPIDPARIDQATAELLKDYDIVLLEGAGGLMVPLSRSQTLLDFAAERAYPLVLVTSGRLGSINHTLLSLQAARSAGLPLHRLVYNRHPAADLVIGAETERYLRDYLCRHFPNAEWAVLEEIPLKLKTPHESKYKAT